MKEPAGMLIMGHALLLDGQNKGYTIILSAERGGVG